MERRPGPRPAGRALPVAAVGLLLTALAGAPANADNGTVDPRPALRKAAERIGAAWLVRTDPDRRIELEDEDIRRLEHALVDCRTASVALTTPPWPRTVVEFLPVTGPRQTFRLVDRHVRVDTSHTREPGGTGRSRSRYGPTDDSAPRTVYDCFPGEVGAAALLAIHRRHLGPSRVKAYRPVPDRAGSRSDWRDMPF